MSTLVRNSEARMAVVLLVVTWSTGLPNEARGADTIETFDIGSTDLEYYLGLDGIGLGAGERTVSSAVVLGYGIVDRFSGYLSATMQSDDQFGQGLAGLSMGVFGTPLDTRHFDLDLMLDSGISGAGLSEFSLTPGIEINIDASPDHASWGTYLRTGMPIYGGSSHGGPHHTDLSDAGRMKRTFSLCLNPGAYVTVASGHMLFLEYDMSVHYRKVDGRSWDSGGLALGYNAALWDSIELISQLYLDLPQDDERFSAGVFIGFIATLPIAR